jgi:hypothetical protein
MTKALTGVLLAVAVLTLETAVHATTINNVPEISPTTMSAGVAALAAGVLVIRARLRSK